jgi:hypothetical protein
MAIDATMRGVLEQYIDSIVIALPNIIKVFLILQIKHCKYMITMILHVV